MLRVTQLSGFGGGRRGGWQADPDLLWHWDAAHATSYPGTGQLVANLGAGDGGDPTVYDVHRGIDGTVQDSDPPWHGTPGGMSGAEYFQLGSPAGPGVDQRCRLTIAGANTALIESLHKPGAAWTVAIAHQAASGAGGSATLFATSASSGAGRGVRVGDGACDVGNGSTLIVNYTYPTTPPNGAWNVIVLTIDAAASAGRVLVNTNFHTFSPSYASASSSAAEGKATFGTEPGGGGQSHGWLGRFAMWSRALTQPEMESVSAAWRARYT